VVLRVIGENLKLSETRVATKNLDGSVELRDNVRKLQIQISPERWATLGYLSDEIEEARTQLENKQYVKYQQHIGDNWYVSITTGYRCVDIRRFYQCNGELKPTREGLALRLDEWKNLNATLRSVALPSPAVHQCYCGNVHQKLEAFLQYPPAE
jgi:hypothetical protein